MYSAPITFLSGPTPPPPPEKTLEQRIWGKDGFSFHSIVDALNPLQHIPVIGTLYRAITGETLSPGSRVLGDVLFSGPIGLATAMADVETENLTGKDIGANLLALVTGPEPGSAPAMAPHTAIAAAPAPAPVKLAAEDKVVFTPWATAGSAAPEAAPLTLVSTESAKPDFSANMAKGLEKYTAMKKHGAATGAKVDTVH